MLTSTDSVRSEVISLVQRFIIKRLVIALKIFVFHKNASAHPRIPIFPCFTRISWHQQKRSSSIKPRTSSSSSWRPHVPTRRGNVSRGRTLHEKKSNVSLPHPKRPKFPPKDKTERKERANLPGRLKGKSKLAIIMLINRYHPRIHVTNEHAPLA
jgi:hypothetical protein